LEVVRAVMAELYEGSSLSPAERSRLREAAVAGRRLAEKFESARLAKRKRDKAAVPSMDDDEAFYGHRLNAGPSGSGS